MPETSLCPIKEQYLLLAQEHGRQCRFPLKAPKGAGLPQRPTSNNQQEGSCHRRPNTNEELPRRHRLIQSRHRLFPKIPRDPYHRLPGLTFDAS